MRYPVRALWTAPNPGSNLALVEVESAFFRSLWFRSTGGPATYTLRGYLTEQNAIDDTDRLLEATHGPGPSVLVPMTLSAGAPVDVTPTTVRLFAVGVWTDAVLGWSDDVEMVVIDRIVRVLENYRAPFEALEAVQRIQIGHTMPETAFPVIGVTTGLSEVTQKFGANLWMGLVDIEVVVWSLHADPETAKRENGALCGSLRSICLDENRTWGGVATETTARGGVRVANDQVENGWIYESILPLTVQMAEARGQRTVGGQQSDGGKYTEGL